jgi:hypothetical protein
MTEDITAYALGLRHLSENDDAEPIEAAFIPSIGVMPLTEAHALGATLKRVHFSITSWTMDMRLFATPICRKADANKLSEPALRSKTCRVRCARF